MNTPSPLVPQGSIQPRGMSGAAKVKLAVGTVIGLHVVGFGLLLLQGCQKDAKKPETAAFTETNQPAPLSLPAIDTNTYFTNASTLPLDTRPVTNAPAPIPAPATNIAAYEPIAPAPAPAPAAPEERDYVVAKGETLAAIAKKHAISLAALNKANPGLDPRKLKVGQKIKVPAATPAPAAAPQTARTETSAHAAPAPSSAPGVHIVKAGETLTRIAAKNGVSVNALRAANNLKTTRLLVGQKLKIPSKAPAKAAAVAAQPAAAGGLGAN